MWLFLAVVGFVHGGLFKDSPPIPNAGKQSFLIPRAISFLSHHFASRESRGNFKTWVSPADSNASENDLFPKLEPYYDVMEKKTKWKERGAEELASDWGQPLESKRKNDLLLRFFGANPSFRKTEFSGEELCGSGYQSHKGTRVHQVYAEPGMPTEVPCHSCSPDKRGLLTSFHILPKRDFLLPEVHFENRSERLHTESTNAAIRTPFLSFYLQSINKALKSGKHAAATLLQLSGRSGGGIISAGNGKFHTGSGNLQILPPSDFLRRIFRETPTDTSLANIALPMGALSTGLTIQCAQSQTDGKLASTNVLVNVDTFGRDGNDTFETEKFKIYETLKSDWSNASAPELNLKLKISWNDWGCCSACCCPVKMCGVFATEKKCDQVASVKTRTGYVALKKINENAKIDLSSLFGNVSEEVERAQLHLENLFSISPYRDKGVALFSTAVPLPLRQPIIQFFLSGRAPFPPSYKGLGLFVATSSCKDDLQKKNCHEWARCRQMSLPEDRTPEEPLVERDVCERVPFHTLTLDEDENYFKLEKNQSYRLQVEETLVSGGKVYWRVGGKKAPKYRMGLHCHEQGIAAHPWGKLLLITRKAKIDEEIMVEARLQDGRTLKAVLHRKEEEKEREEDNTLQMLIVYTTITLVGITVFLVLAVIANECRRKVAAHRLEKKLKKEKKETLRNEATDASKASHSEV